MKVSHHNKIGLGRGSGGPAGSDVAGEFAIFIIEMETDGTTSDNKGTSTKI
jgi:hypothetical protein